MACARLRQPCATGPGTPGNQVCCPHLACDTDLTCCKPENESCLADVDCCAGNVCRPNPSGLGNRCLPPGAVGAECVEDLDCAGGLACDPYTATCLSVLGNPCVSDDECGSGFCDPYTFTCSAPCAGVTCTPAECQTGGSCNPATSLCEFTDAINGTPCTGGTCQAGVCTPSVDLCVGPVCSAPPDPLCYNVPGTCDPATGACTYTPLTDGSLCSIGTCQSGTCTPTIFDPCLGISCVTPGACQGPQGTCIAGGCFYPPAVNGTPCAGGTCQNGSCLPT
jgi:hypothetical protein